MSPESHQRVTRTGGSPSFPRLSRSAPWLPPDESPHCFPTAENGESSPSTASARPTPVGTERLRFALSLPASAEERKTLEELSKRAARSAVLLVVSLLGFWIILLSPVFATFDALSEGVFQAVVLAAVGFVVSSFGGSFTFNFWEGAAPSLLAGSLTWQITPTLLTVGVATWGYLLGKSSQQNRGPLRASTLALFTTLAYTSTVLFSVGILKFATSRYVFFPVNPDTTYIGAGYPPVGDFAFIAMLASMTVLLGHIAYGPKNSISNFITYLFLSIRNFIVLVALVGTPLALWSAVNSTLAVDFGADPSTSFRENLANVPLFALIIVGLLILPSLLIKVFWSTTGAVFEIAVSESSRQPILDALTLILGDGQSLELSQWGPRPITTIVLIVLAISLLIAAAYRASHRVHPGPPRWWSWPLGLAIAYAGFATTVHLVSFGQSFTLYADPSAGDSNSDRPREVIDNVTSGFGVNELSVVLIGLVTISTLLLVARPRVQKLLSALQLRVVHLRSKKFQYVGAAVVVILATIPIAQSAAERFLESQSGPKVAVEDSVTTLLQGSLAEAKALYGKVGSAPWLPDAVLAEHRLASDTKYTVEYLNSAGDPWQVGDLDGLALISLGDNDPLEITISFVGTLQSNLFGVTQVTYETAIVRPTVEFLIAGSLNFFSDTTISIGDEEIEPGRYSALPGHYRVADNQKLFLKQRGEGVPLAQGSTTVNLISRLDLSDTVTDQLTGAVNEFVYSLCENGMTWDRSNWQTMRGPWTCYGFGENYRALSQPSPEEYFGYYDQTFLGWDRFECALLPTSGTEEGMFLEEPSFVTNIGCQIHSTVTRNLYRELRDSRGIRTRGPVIYAGDFELYVDWVDTVIISVGGNDAVSVEWMDDCPDFQYSRNRGYPCYNIDKYLTDNNFWLSLK
jgi:hypothetical protein